MWLKLESSQPSASFKLRGMGLAAERAVAAGASRLVSSSGGNAGYAVAWAGRTLGVPVTVVVPSTTGVRHVQEALCLSVCCMGQWNSMKVSHRNGSPVGARLPSSSSSSS